MLIKSIAEKGYGEFLYMYMSAVVDWWCIVLRKLYHGCRLQLFLLDNGVSVRPMLLNCLMDWGSVLQHCVHIYINLSTYTTTPTKPYIIYDRGGNLNDTAKLQLK